MSDKVEMMCENLNAAHHVQEWEKRCLKAEAEVERLQDRERGYLAELADYGRTVERLNAEVKAEREQRNLLSDMLDKERDRSDTMRTHEKAWLSQMTARCIPRTKEESDV